MPEPYKPNGSDVTYTVPSLDDPADGPQAFRDFADSIPPDLSAAIPVEIKTEDYTLALKDAGAAVFFDTTTESHKVTVPAHADVAFSVGSAIVIGNVGKNKDGNVQITPADGVTVRDTAVRKVGLNRMAVILQVEQDSWIINAGTGGGPAPGSVPSPPKLTSAIGGPECAYLNWDKPVDDGGHDITTYTVEKSTDQTTWTICGQTDPTVTSTQVTGLASGTKVYFRVKAANIIGLSDPSNVLDATPKDDYNDAEGGVVTQYTKNGRTYRVHTFTSTGTLKINKASVPFRILAVAAGADGSFSGDSGNGGGGGKVVEVQSLVPVGVISAVIGRTSNESSSFGDTVTASGIGAPGGVGGFRITNPGNPGTASDITGVSVVYGGSGGTGGSCSGYQFPAQCGRDGGDGGGGRGGGGCEGQGGSGSCETPSTPGANGLGGGGGGGGGTRAPGTPCGPKPGGSGIVIVSYEVAPFNDAEGGSTSYYSKDGKVFKVHTFKWNDGNDQLVVKNASSPFQVLLFAGGGAPGAENYNAGGGGAGGYILDLAKTLEAKTYPISVGRGATSVGLNGSDTTAFGLTAKGGGAGGIFQGGGGTAGKSGGSGGGGGGGGAKGGAGPAGGGGGATAGQGFGGGQGATNKGPFENSSIGIGGGGGGAGGAAFPGGPEPSDGGTAAGPGKVFLITGASVTAGAGGAPGGGYGAGWDGTNGAVIVAYEVASAPSGDVLMDRNAWMELAAREAVES